MTNQTTVSFKLTNTCRYATSFVAIGTNTLTRLAPPNGSNYSGSLGSYSVEWTNANGLPGFTSIKWTPNFNSFDNGAMDVFRIVVTNFNPSTTIQVSAKSRTQETFNFSLTCSPVPP
jgi:hypothetical protein